MTEEELKKIEEEIKKLNVDFIVGLVKSQNIEQQLVDCVVALCQADLFKYQNKEGARERWGLRYSKDSRISSIMSIINGMALRIEELENAVIDLTNEKNRLITSIKLNGK